MSLPASDRPLSRGKRILFFSIMQLLLLLVAVLGVEGYYLYGYQSYRDHYCGSFAQLDDEIGWVLRPAAVSCVGSGQSAPSSKVYINADGARAGRTTDATPANGLLAIGDSWTFGYGINWEDTFAAQLTRAHNRPTALVASPAYSGAQALLLARRYVATIAPKTIIYWDRGFWQRGVCSGTSRPTTILKPCYWVDPDHHVELVTPRPGYVHRMSKFGLRPGGMLGAGENTLTYFLIARPVARLKQVLVRLGVISGFGNDFAAWGREEDFALIRAAHLRQLLSLAKQANARLLLIDPNVIYETGNLAAADREHLIYVGPSEWDASVGKPMLDLPAALARVPGDGHFGPGAHRLIAAMIDSTLKRGN